MTAPFRPFSAEVRRVQRLSPSFQRVTLTGADLHRMADNGYDQRLKVLLPLPGLGTDHLDLGDDWYGAWRALPEERRNPMRTYTVRAVRPQEREVDVDVVLHGDSGPASTWATHARAGDPVVLVGPDATFEGVHGGREFRPTAAPVLLAGDETAVPAVLAILERLPAAARGAALLEVPDQGDALPVHCPTGVTVTWLARGDQPHGTLLVPAVVAAARELSGASPVAAAPPAEPGDDDDLLWEVPEQDCPGAPFTAWLAGEAAVMRVLRRELRDGLGLDRRLVSCMGYWRSGRSED